MSDVLYLAWKYLSYHRLKTVILVASITLIIYLPIGLNVLVNESSRQLTARADATPLLVGAKGSPLELVLRSLYFESDVPASMRYTEAQRIAKSGFATAIPLHSRFRTRHSPIVGTSLEYFRFRNLELLTEGLSGCWASVCWVRSRPIQPASVPVIPLCRLPKASLTLPASTL